MLCVCVSVGWEGEHMLLPPYTSQDVMYSVVVVLHAPNLRYYDDGTGEAYYTAREGMK